MSVLTTAAESAAAAAVSSASASTSAAPEQERSGFWPRNGTGRGLQRETLTFVAAARHCTRKTARLEQAETTAMMMMMKVRLPQHRCRQGDTGREHVPAAKQLCTASRQQLNRLCRCRRHARASTPTRSGPRHDPQLRRAGSRVWQQLYRRPLPFHALVCRRRNSSSRRRLQLQLLHTSRRAEGMTTTMTQR
jgi:hypothetical protein